jgi:hypothetical protein
MQTILSASIVLGGLLVWKFVGPPGVPTGGTVVVEKETREAYDLADAARRRIQILERKAWSSDEPGPLGAEEISQIGRHLLDLDASDRRFQRLDALLRKHHLEASADMKELTVCWLRTRIWKLDAQAVVGVRSDPSALPGFYLPLHRALDRWEKTRDELRELRDRADPRGEERTDDPQARKILDRLQAIRETLAEIRDEFLRLEALLSAGLRRESLPAGDLPDVELLRESASLVQQAMVSAGDLRLRFGVR